MPRQQAQSLADAGEHLACLGLARASALIGDRTNARVGYQEFLALWKDADHDIPILKRARVEYAGLN